MLILTRHIGEKVIIGDSIFCTVLGVNGRQIRLGFSAPDAITVNREEIYLKIKAERKSEGKGDAEFDVNLIHAFICANKNQLNH